MNSKQMAAAIAAVFEYIRSEEEALCVQAMYAARQAAPPAPAMPPARPWGISGRQQQMDLRNLMQLRAFAGSRLR
jgi:hypothetical protein